MTARNHHYLSQCYLRGFTKGGSKKSKLTVIDLKKRKQFETVPRNVGGIRDFNRIDIEGVDQNTLEKSLSHFEGDAASALRLLENNLRFEGETKMLILNLIALIAIRSPERREHWRKLQGEVIEKIMDLSIATKERWETLMNKMIESGIEIKENITYEDMKCFHQNNGYDISVAREHHIYLEFVGIDSILPYLYSRNWLLIKATEKSGPFITTDNPVTLTWKEPDKISHLYRLSPGYGMNSTQIYFPVSRSIALIGEFDGYDGVIEGNRDLVAALNSKVLMFANKQVYCPKISFYFRGAGGAVFEGTQVLRYVCV